MNNKRLSIIIPCYNEEGTVGLVVERLLNVPFSGWDPEIIVINDGSTDGTATVLEKFATKVRVINLVQNSGKGSAVKAGITAATGDYAIIQDADLECTPEEIPLLLVPLQGISSDAKVVVMGSRELNREGDSGKGKFFPRIGSLSITKLINFLYGSSLTDALMGYKLFPRATFDYFTVGRFEAEMIFITRVLKEGYKIVEVPVSYDPRAEDAGKKIRYRDGIKIILRILRFWATGR
ncbi:MAG: glycosyltransferase family 2 protein [bacterium]|nr:glycosyltransferase family 2 protein [bacterium]